MRPALIVEVKGNSLDDGPGIRSVVFFKGCPLDCVWCHNPEAKRLDREIAFDRSRCRGTLACVEACEPRALDRSSPEFVDRTRCTLCGRCVEACPFGAFEIVGRALDVEEIVSTAARYEAFYRASGGGVTLSGGEPMLFPEEAGALLRRLKERGIHTLLETCGLFSLDRYTALAEPHLDQVYFDLKIADDAEHRRWCGTSNRTILSNFRELRRRADAGGVPVLPRVPLVPNITATAANLRAIAALLRESAAGEVALLAYNPLWGDKARKLGAAVGVDRTTWMSREELDWCRSFFDGIRITS
ncbi:MAG: glycyl-radical enzyme activating protein [Actinomycetota bacterium]